MAKCDFELVLRQDLTGQDNSHKEDLVPTGLRVRVLYDCLPVLLALVTLVQVVNMIIVHMDPLVHLRTLTITSAVKDSQMLTYCKDSQRRGL